MKASEIIKKFKQDMETAEMDEKFVIAVGSESQRFIFDMNGCLGFFQTYLDTVFNFYGQESALGDILVRSFARMIRNTPGIMNARVVSLHTDNKSVH